MSDLLNTPASYGDDAIVTLTPREHIRLRPGMYIGKLGDGSQPDDGIYVLIKEVVDNSVDEFIMGAGKQIEITVVDNVVTVRDYGRGIPLKSLAAAVSEMNTGGKYGGTAFKKTVRCATARPARSPSRRASSRATAGRAAWRSATAR